MSKFYLKLLLVLFIAIKVSPVYTQVTYFGDEPVTWHSAKIPIVPALSNIDSSQAIVILDDKANFSFYATNNEKITRHILVKINTKQGLELFQSYKLPESFDKAYDANLYKQGRKSKIKIPFIAEYHVIKFGARKFSGHKWETVSFNLSYQKCRWIKYTGEFINDEITDFKLQGLAVGDIVELIYEAEFNSMYGSNLFYLHSDYPKLICEYTFNYKVQKMYTGYKFILPVNLKDSAVTKTYIDYGDYVIFTDKIKITNAFPINYPANSNESKTLPHVFADFKFYRVANGSYPTGSGRLYEYDLFRPKNFEWIIYKDTLNNYTKIYDKQFTAIRKFTATLPTLTADSTNITFFKALCDTFNNFRFISANQLFYNESALYNLYSGDHILKRRLVEHTMWKLYRDILNDKKVFYYVANIQDRRYGEHSLANRAHYAYETDLIAIPSGNSYIYFMPRYQGMKYQLNELPFYYEGSLAALTAKNFQENIKDKDEKTFKLLKTHRGTFNENTRSENATVQIKLDSLKASSITKESLSGQFSTILRHLYLNEFIDSTISPVYFKKCTDKPNSTATQIKLSSNINEFPFRYTFNCSQNLSLKDSKNFNMKNWFSFTLNKILISELPTCDYYFDFDFSDSYNFLLKFNTPIEIANINDFTKKINNNCFEMESGITKNSDTEYLVRVKVVVKQLKLPVEQAERLLELAKEMDVLNNFSLALVKK